jgi:hypothetical protein
MIVANLFRFTIVQTRYATYDHVAQIGGISLTLKGKRITGSKTYQSAMRKNIPRIIKCAPVGFHDETPIDMFANAEVDPVRGAPSFAISHYKWCFGFNSNYTGDFPSTFWPNSRPYIIFRFDEAVTCDGVYLATGGDDTGAGHRQVMGWDLDAVVTNRPGGPQWMNLVSHRYDGRTFAEYGLAYIFANQTFYGPNGSEGGGYAPFPFSPRPIIGQNPMFMRYDG